MSTRRQFLQQSALISLSPWIPAFLPRSLKGATAQRDERILVVVEMNGGNDGLNTVIPYADENYAKFRKELLIASKDVVKLNDTLGLNPGMKLAGDLFEDGRLRIVQGVGYPNPNRSHFESMSIWQHARLESREHDSIGWLGRTADLNRSSSSQVPDSIFVGESALPVALRGRRANAVSLANEADLKLLTPHASVGGEGDAADDLSAFVSRTVDNSYAAARRFSESEAKSDSSVSYPFTGLAGRMKLISRLIKLGGGTRIYYVSQGGYDTHAAQKLKHQALLGELSGAIKAFLNDLRESGLEERVVVLAFSEFGRRVQENGSAGTDHGAAAPVLLAGTPIAGGILGEHPSLTDLDQGDLKMSIDFRQVYGTLLDQWLEVDSRAVLGESFAPVELLRS